MDIIVPQSDETTEDAPAAIRRLQRLLAEAIEGRAWALARMFQLENAAPDHHWFVGDPAGYCQACNLPEANARHVPRAA